jgi:hypothetical protein
MYKKILILAVTMLLFFLGINYLLVYTLKQNATRERERRDKVYWAAYNAIEHFGERADEDSEHRAKVALEKARKEGLSQDRETILQSYFQDLQRCYENEPESCKRVNEDINQAIQAPR